MSLVKSFSVGDGDTFYIRHNSDNFSIIDCCADEDHEYVIDEIKSGASEKGVVRFISTHPDDDHIRGLEMLDCKINIVNFYCVKNDATKPDRSRDFDIYCELRDSEKTECVNENETLFSGI